MAESLEVSNGRFVVSPLTDNPAEFQPPVDAQERLYTSQSISSSESSENRDQSEEYVEGHGDREQHEEDPPQTLHGVAPQEDTNSSKEHLLVDEAVPIPINALQSSARSVGSIYEDVVVQMRSFLGTLAAQLGYSECGIGVVSGQVRQNPLAGMVADPQKFYFDEDPQYHHQTTPTSLLRSRIKSAYHPEHPHETVYMPQLSTFLPQVSNLPSIRMSHYHNGTTPSRVVHSTRLSSVQQPSNDATLHRSMPSNDATIRQSIVYSVPSNQNVYVSSPISVSHMQSSRIPVEMEQNYTQDTRPRPTQEIPVNHIVNRAEKTSGASTSRHHETLKGLGEFFGVIGEFGEVFDELANYVTSIEIVKTKTGGKKAKRSLPVQRHCGLEGAGKARKAGKSKSKKRQSPNNYGVADDISTASSSNESPSARGKHRGFPEVHQMCCAAADKKRIESYRRRRRGKDSASGLVGHWKVAVEEPLPRGSTAPAL